jgi:hypothetical protein
MAHYNDPTQDDPGCAPDLQRHSRRCVICRHRDRIQIDYDFVHWGHPDNIVRDYNIRHRSLLYRHARATGLYAIRSRNLRSALDHIIERIAETPVNSAAEVRAVRIYAHLNDRGAWVEPTRKVVFAREDKQNAPFQLVLSESLASARRERSEAIAAHERERLAAQNPERSAPPEREGQNSAPDN